VADDVELAACFCVFAALVVGGGGLGAGLVLGRLGRRLRDLEGRLARLEELGVTTPTAAEQGEPGREGEVAPPEPAPVPVVSAPAPSAAPAASRPLPGEPVEAAPEPAPAPPAPPEDAPPPPRRPRLRPSTLIFAGGGGLALAAAAALAVQYLGEQGLLGPGVRVAGGLVLGLALVAGGGRLGQRVPPVAAALQAAGVVALYATVLVATRVYGFLEWTVGTAGLVATTGLALVLSRKRGALLALIALLGGFATPALLDADRGDPALLFAYLLILELALLWTARRAGDRGAWPVVAALAMVGAWAWVGTALAAPGRLGGVPGGALPWIGLPFVLASVAAFTGWLATSPAEGFPRRLALGLAVPTLGMGFLVAAALVDAADHRAVDWALFGCLGVLAIFLARDGVGRLPIPGVAALITLALLASWLSDVRDVPPSDVRNAALSDVRNGVSDVRNGGLLVVRLLTVFVGLTGVYAVGPLLACLGRPVRGATGLRLFAVSAALPFAGLTLRAIRIGWGTDAGPTVAGRVLGGALVAALAAGYAIAGRRGPAGPPRATLLGGAAAVAALLPVAVVDPSAWPVSWAILAAAEVHLAGRLRLPVLARVGVAAAGLALIALALTPPPDAPGLAALRVTAVLLALAFAAEVARRDGATLVQQLLDLLTLVAGGVLGVALGRWAAAPGDRDLPALLRGGPGAGALLASEVAVAGLARWLGPRRRSPALRVGAWVLLAASGGVAVLGPGLAGNPVLTGDPVGGTPLWNPLLATYLLPAVTATLVSHLAFAPGAADAGEPPSSLDRVVRLGLRIVGLVLGTGWLLIAIRHGFHAPRLGPDVPVVPNENGLYSAALVGLGAGLFVLATRTGDRVHRFAALGFLVVASCKVFLVDVAALGGLLRILSFLGLGAALLALAWLDQRLLRGASPAPPDAPPGTP